MISEVICKSPGPPCMWRGVLEAEAWVAVPGLPSPRTAAVPSLPAHGARLSGGLWGCSELAFAPGKVTVLLVGFCWEFRRNAGGAWREQPAPSMVTERPVPIPLFRSPPQKDPAGLRKALSPLGATGHHGVQLCDGDAFLCSSNLTKTYRNF